MLENEETSNVETTIEEKEVVLESVGQILVEEEIDENTEVDMEIESNGLVKELLAGVVDQIIVAAVALIALLLFNLILKPFGYYIAEKEPMYLIIYVITNIIYGPICNKLKIKGTVGKKVLLNK